MRPVYNRSAMGFEVRRRLSAADAVTLVNAIVGFVAGAVAFTDLQLAARLMLAAVVVDALDGIVARSGESSDVGPLLDSITDVVSFGATPSLFVYVLLTERYGGIETLGVVPFLGVVLLASCYVVFSVLRTAFYSVYFDAAEERPGMPNTLGTMILGTAFLAGVVDPVVLAIGTAVLAVVMVAPFDYPKPGANVAIPMGVVLAVAVLAPTAFSRAGPRLMLGISLLFFALGPRYYWLE